MVRGSHSGSSCRLGHCPRGGRETGVALLTALLVSALAGVAATAIMVRSHAGMMRTQHQLDTDQAELYASGAEGWASGMLARDRLTGSHDHLAEPWANAIPALGGAAGVSVRIDDMQGRFNLNNLVQRGEVSRPDLARFRRLLGALELPPSLGDAVLDWLDSDQRTSGSGGAEDPYYLSLRSPYRAANGPLASVAELHLVRGMSDRLFDVLEPHVSALPARTRINVNTASAAVIASIVENLSERDAGRLVAAPRAFASIEAFLATPEMAGTRTALDTITVSSDYFRLRSRVSVGRGNAEFDTLLERDPSGKVHVVSRLAGGS